MLSGKDDFDIINILKDIHNIVKDIYNDTIILIEKIKPKFDEIIIGYENTLKEKDVKNEELNKNLKQSQLELSLKDNYIKEILEENKSLITELKDYQNNKNNTSNKNRFLNLNSNSEENLICQ
jgi:aspartyl-tRNA synthetase